LEKLIIDLMKCRECKSCKILALKDEENKNKSIFGIKNILQMALFSLTCRKCEDSPCVNVCPQDALKKNRDCIVVRNSNLCIGCKSCVLACPFGTIPHNLMTYVYSKDSFVFLNEKKSLEECIKKCKNEAIKIVEDEEEIKEKWIYKLVDNVYIKDFKWEEVIKKC